MEESYFLGANSRRGFVSLYGGFAAAPGDTLHVIKGGPGTGKSGFMRRIAEAAQARGLDTELIRCSGDPDSLDGVYIPALRQAWADGTAPHTLDPAHFGADGDYVDLGRFCGPLRPEDRERVIAWNAAYKGRYAAAYRWLAAAGDLEDAAAAPPLPAPTQEKLRRRIRGILQRQTQRQTEPGGERRRFLSAITGKGLLRLPPGCPTVYRLDSRRGLETAALRIAAEEAAERGLPRVLCPSPLDPERPEALLLPGAGLAFLSGDCAAAPTHSIRLDALLPPEEREEKLLRRRALQLRRAALEAATGQLREAKSLHDELEAVYRPYMDFAALTAFTDGEIERIFR